jgi:hypothetical protein
MFAQFASVKIQLENAKMEPPANLIVLSHSELNLNRKRVYHPLVFPGTKGGIVSYKSFVERQLLGDLYSSAKELPVHCTDFKSKAQ